MNIPNSTLYLLVVSLMTFACGPDAEKRAPDPTPTVAKQEQQERMVADEPAADPIVSPSPEIIEKCKVFMPPWGAGGWVEWGQNNPEKGEEWYDTVEEKMKAADLSVLPRCTHLENMFVGFSELKDLAPLAKLSGLKRLDVRMIPDIKDLSPLQGLANLEYLNITGTGVEDLSPAAKLEELTEIEARMLTAADLTPLSKLPKLKIVDMLKCPVTDLSPMSESPSLEKALFCNTDVADISVLGEISGRITALDLCDTKFRDFDQLKKFPHLTFLRLWGLPIEDLSVLSHMKDMEDLDLSKTPVKDLTPLHGMKNLKVLRLLMVEMDQRQLDDLKKAIPGVEIIRKITPL